MLGNFSVTNIFKFLTTRSKPMPPVPEAIWHDPLYFLAFGLGTGAIPIAPGTFGTLMAIPFYLMLRPLPLIAYLLMVMAFIGFAAWLSAKLSQQTATHDHPGMNIDEFAGFFVTMIAAPWGWPWVVLGFILFRIFDVLKPWPINYVDKHMHSGLGMILDDVLAGIYAWLIIQIIAKTLAI